MAVRAPRTFVPRLIEGTYCSADPNVARRYARWCPPPGIRPDPTIWHELPGPEPETRPEDRDDDRLATELFRRFGSVERDTFRRRDDWVADATAIRTIVASDQAFARILEELASAPVRISTGDGEAHAASWSEGFDEAWRQRDELEATWRSRVQLVAISIGLIAGAIAYWPVRLYLARRDRS